MIRLPEYVRDVLDRLEANKYSAYLVGGCLRDMLLGRPINDWDIATSASCAAVVSLFPKTAETGLRYGTVTVITGEGNVEVTTLRSDGVYSDGRRPDSVTYTVDLNKDLKRRDFTVNAMAMAPGGELIDLLGGREDIDRRLIRCVGDPAERFAEDALRMFRALRFSAQLGFDIDIGTLAAIRENAALCSALSAERVRDETEKILMSDRPEIVGTAIESGLFAGRLNPEAGKPEKLERIAKLQKNSMMRWSAFCALLLSAGLIDSATEFLKKMRLDAQTVRAGGTGARLALEQPMPDRTGIKRMLSVHGVEATLCAAAADDVLRGGDASARVAVVIGSSECFMLKDLAVTGEDLAALGFKPGPGLGAALNSLLEHVIGNPGDNSREALLLLVEKARSQGEMSR